MIIENKKNSYNLSRGNCGVKRSGKYLSGSVPPYIITRHLDYHDHHDCVMNTANNKIRTYQLNRIIK